MTKSPVSQRTEAALDTISPLMEFFANSRWARRFGSPGVCDFTIGNPHEMPLPSFVAALKHWVVPQDAYWYAYKMNEDPAREIVAGSLLKWRGIPFDPKDIFLTNGATGALAVALHSVVDPGDEVIFTTPSWFLYETMIMNLGALPVKIKAVPESFDLDLAALERSITPRTRAVIINSPNNPTGKVYSEETLARLGKILTKRSSDLGRTVYLISDEAYARIVFDGKRYPNPCSFYDSTFLVYTYGKTLLTPGERIGFLAFPPAMPERLRLRKAILCQQMLNSWAFPNALLLHALGDLDKLALDLEVLQRKRDRMVMGLRDAGYTLNDPEGTFYSLVRSPIADDQTFTGLLAERDLFCIPGSLQGAQGYFRLSLTATEEMIERALPIFAQVLDEVKAARV